VKLPRVLHCRRGAGDPERVHHLRDRFLFALLYDSGVRIGEALGLRHEDIAIAEREITVVPRANDNGARSKSALKRTIPVSAELIRLYGDYLHAGIWRPRLGLRVVNLFAEPRGHALSYPAVYDLVLRLRSRTGIDFDPHWCRHGLATRMLRDGSRSRSSRSCSATPRSRPRSRSTAT